MPEDERLGEALSDSAIEALATGAIEVKGRMPWSSNATLLVHVTPAGGDGFDAIYKPLRGERPLWDFPEGLYRREVAAFVLDRLLGWAHVPETIVRYDAPFGVGSLQRFVKADFGEHYFTMLEAGVGVDALREIAVFDLAANNADRKGGHCLLGADGRVWAIDHGVCFSDEPDKLRTVMWDFAGEPLPERLRADVARVADDDLEASFADLLDAEEIEALHERLLEVAATDRFPSPGPGRPFPWPLV